MMTHKIMPTLLGTAFVAFAGYVLFTTSTQAAPPADEKIAPKAVESDPHEFMEYVFQPTFKDLKSAMNSGASDKLDWKAIKSSSLILAEGGNLLLIRKPDENAQDWAKHASHVRTHGGKLYRAAQSKDSKSARKYYETMVQNCNDCHQQFAHGEHMLKP